MLGKDESFKAAHLSPLPFHFVPARGKLIFLKCGDGKEASAFEVKAEQPTANFLFVFHEWWGLNDYIKQKAEALQLELKNVNAIAMDMYDGKTAANAEDASKLMQASDEKRIKSLIAGSIRINYFYFYFAQKRFFGRGVAMIKNKSR